MNHQGTKILDTERLLLRPFAREDGRAMFYNWASDPVVTEFLSWPTHGDISISNMVVESWVNERNNQKSYLWAIVPKEVGEPIGSISVVGMDEETQWVEVGYCIGRNWWHRGFTSEALSAVIRYLFQEVGVNRIQATHDVNNPNSGAVMRKCGMVYEGTLRQYGRNNTGTVDVAIYAILKRDYQE